ncbi:MAG: ATP-NAD kinase family protein [Syntrophomonadaceae bacterium]|nr:ATP-NAD kinase family protein [Syntrophomonadaceae bacterium]MDD3890165.1 ATP-NAD kinase family protein [Syntrophomonadaceae bacterium]
MKKLGLIVNPVAGIGGEAGLKGSDGADILKQALELGSKPRAPERAIQALQMIARIKDQIEIVTYPAEMGEDEARKAGFNPLVIGSIASGATTSEDTIKAAKKMVTAGVDMILFTGGDGTARNIYTAVGTSIPVLGIPAGVKIHSAVYAINPRSAGIVAAQYMQGEVAKLREAEVMDIDEEAFRQGHVSARLYGYMQVPEEKRLVQNIKAGCHSEESTLRSLSAQIVKEMDPEFIYIIGPGSTMKYVMDFLGLGNTLLGVDVVQNQQLIASDVNEKELWELLKDDVKAKIIVTVIGGQGHIFGRGNQQISPRIIRKVGKDNIIIAASTDKLYDIHPQPLLVDTGDVELDQELCGYIHIRIGNGETIIHKVSM